MVINTCKKLCGGFLDGQGRNHRDDLDEVSTEFGMERIKGIKYFGPYEGEDLVGIVYVEGIDERKDTVGVDMRLFDMFDEMESQCTLCIARAKEGMGKEVAG